MAAASPDLSQLLSNQMENLLSQIKKDIEETSALTDKDRENCMAICQRVEKEHRRLKIGFLQTSLRLIDQAMETSDEEKLRQIHQAWALALENILHQCETLAGPLQEVIDVLSRESAEMKIKYSGIPITAALSSILGGLTMGAMIAYSHPDYFMGGARQNMHVAIPALAIISATIYTIRKLTSTNATPIYRNWREHLPSFLTTYNSDHFAGNIMDTSESDVINVIKTSIDKLNIDEHVWRNHEELQLIKESIQCQLEQLDRLE